MKPSYIRRGFSSSLIIIVWLFHIFPAMIWKILARFSRFLWDHYFKQQLSCHLQQMTTFKAKLLKKKPSISTKADHIFTAHSVLWTVRDFQHERLTKNCAQKKWTSLVQNTANKRKSKIKTHFIEWQYYSLRVLFSELWGNLETTPSILIVHSPTHARTDS